MVNQFIYSVQVPVVERRCTILSENSGVVIQPTKNVSNHNHLAQKLVPSPMRDQGHVTSQWRGRPKAPTSTLAATPIIGHPITPLCFMHTVLPPLKPTVSPTDGDDTWWPRSEEDSSAISPPPSEPSPSPTLGDDTWFASSEVLSALDKASATDVGAQRKPPRASEISPCHTLLSPSHMALLSIASLAVHSTPQSCHKLTSLSLLDSEDEQSPPSSPLPASALNKFARPRPHIRQPIPDQQVIPGIILPIAASRNTSAATCMTNSGIPACNTSAATHTINSGTPAAFYPPPDSTINKPGPSLPAAVDPAVMTGTMHSGVNSPFATGSTISSVLSIQTDMAAPDSSALFRSLPSAYGRFNPIVPPGPCSERWLMEHKWPPIWANIL